MVYRGHSIVNSPTEELSQQQLIDHILALVGGDPRMGLALHGATGLVVSNDAPVNVKSQARQAKALMGDRVQICDGTSDQTEINSVIDTISTAGGGKVHLTEGTFTVSAAVVMKDNVMLDGMGSGALSDTTGTTTIQAAGSSGSYNLIEGDNKAGVGYVRNCHIRDMALYGNKTAMTSGDLIDSSRMHQCRFTNIYGNRGKSGGFFCDSSTAGVEEQIWKNCIADNCDGEQWMFRISLSTFDNCGAMHMDGNDWGMGIRGNLNTITNCWIDGGTAYSGYGFIAHNLENSTINGMRIYKTNKAAFTFYRNTKDVTVTNVNIYDCNERGFVFQPDLANGYGDQQNLILKDSTTRLINSANGHQYSVSFVGTGTVAGVIIMNNSLQFGVEFGTTDIEEYIIKDNLGYKSAQDTQTGGGTSGGSVEGSDLFMIEYTDHDSTDSGSTIYNRIVNSAPTILITATPGGYWSSSNVDPDPYEDLGIKVYSYITGGYEGTKYGDTTDDIDDNEDRIIAIAAEGCTGVFLDEVSNDDPLTTAQKTYLERIVAQCATSGVKLIMNTGLATFDVTSTTGYGTTGLLDYCDYILTDEGYNDDVMTADQTAAGDKCMVATYPNASLSAAVDRTTEAWDRGFKWHYSSATSGWVSCSWTVDYFNAIRGAAGGGTSPDTEDHTANDTLAVSEAGSTHTNSGAAGTITLKLPAGCAIGDWFTFLVKTAQALRIEIDAANGSFLTSAGQTTDDGGDDLYISSSTVGESITLTYQSTGVWWASSVIGTWTITQP